MTDKIILWGTEVYLYVTKYSNNDSLAIILVDKEGEYFGDLTVNLPEHNNIELSALQKEFDENIAYIDTNNFPDAENFIEKYELGTHTYKFGKSGYCTYPLYKFNMEKVKKYQYIKDE